MQLIPDNLNSDTLLSRISQEEIFEKYLQIPVQTRFLVKSPLRKDNTPTAGFYYTPEGMLRFNDFRGDFHGDCFNLVIYLTEATNLIEAVERIYRDFRDKIKFAPGIKHTIPTAAVSKPKADIKVKPRAWNLKDKDYWTSFGITKKLLEEYHIRPAELIWVNDILIYTYEDRDIAYAYYFGNKEYKLYFPLRKDKRFTTNSKSLQGYDQLPESGNTLVFTKSMKDILVLKQAGIPAVAPQGETFFIPEGLIQDLKFRFTNVFSWYDFDYAGIKGANRLKRKYGIRPQFLTNGRFGSIDYKAKDPAEYVQLYGMKELIKLIKTHEYNSTKKAL